MRCLVMLSLFLPAIASSSGLPANLDARLEAARLAWDVPGMAIAIVTNDSVMTRGYGVRELGKPDAVDGETMFDIASLTKSFTAAGAAVLVDEGRLGWDDRVRDRLPAVAFSDSCLNREVTLRDLLCHRVGLQPANALFRFTGYDRAEILRRVRYLEPQAPFRTSMVYSNLLYTVAGEMTAAASGITWAELIRTRIVEPAGMTSTTVETRPAGPNVARPHALIDGVQQPIRAYDYTAVGPCASLFSNAKDMARWLRLQLNEGTLDGRTIVSRASMNEMHSPQIIIRTTPEMRKARLVEHFPGYGLGWQVMDYRGESLLWHTGGADGMPSYMALLPRKGLGLVILANTGNAQGFTGAIASTIMDAYLDVPAHDWSGEVLTRWKSALEGEKVERQGLAARRARAPEPGRELAAYEGTYEATLWGDIHVREMNGALTLQVARGEIADLSPWGPDSLLATWRDPVFREDFNDTVVAFRGEGEGITGLAMTLFRDRIEARRRR